MQNTRIYLSLLSILAGITGTVSSHLTEEDAGAGITFTRLYVVVNPLPSPTTPEPVEFRSCYNRTLYQY